MERERKKSIYIEQRKEEKKNELGLNCQEEK
jgi:hypothetical protein